MKRQWQRRSEVFPLLISEGGRCWGSAWEVSGMEQKGHPRGAGAWATSKQAQGDKHSLPKGWLGLLCTNLNLIWGWQQGPSRKVSLGINRKGSDCFGGILLHRKFKVVSVNKIAGENHRKGNFIYSKQCVCFNSFRHFCSPFFKKEMKELSKLEIIFPCKCTCVERECES